MVRLAPNPQPRPSAHCLVSISVHRTRPPFSSRTVLTDTDSDVSHMSNLGQAGTLHLFKSQVPTTSWSWGILSSSSASLDILPLVMKLCSPMFSQPSAPLCHPCLGPMPSPVLSQLRVPLCHPYFSPLLSELKGQSFC